MDKNKVSGIPLMQNVRIETIPLEDLLVNLTNPRIQEQTNQREALLAIAKSQGAKLYRLAEDIAQRGLNPSELPIVTGPDENGLFTVLEGNRRITALKFLSSTQLAESIGLGLRFAKRFSQIRNNAGVPIPDEIICSVMRQEDSNHWIRLKHTGENHGIGVVSWDGAAKQRFRGQSAALQAIDLVTEANLLDEDTLQKLPGISITNIERILVTPDARDILGVDVIKNELHIVGNENEALARLAIVVRDVANGNVKVSDLDRKEQRVEYARRVVSQPLPKPITRAKSSSSTGVTSTNSASKRIRVVNPTRKALIPKNFKISIEKVRINQIYDELRRLDVESYTNSCAVMLRVFIELSIDHYASKKNISLQQVRKPSGRNNAAQIKVKPKDMTLREKIKTIMDYLKDNQLCTTAELQGIHSIYASRDSLLSIESLNAFVHNMDYNPAPSDLKAHWDKIEPFMRSLWA